MDASNALHSVRGRLAARSRLFRTIGAGFVLGAVLFGSVATVAARPDGGHTLRVTWTDTSYFSTQSDPSGTVFKTGDEIFLGTIVHRFTGAKEAIGTALLHCAVAGTGGSSFGFICDAAFTLPDGKITTQSLFDLQTEVLAPVRKLAITGGTGAYRGATGELTVTVINDTSEMGVFNFDD